MSSFRRGGGSGWSQAVPLPLVLAGQRLGPRLRGNVAVAVVVVGVLVVVHGGPERLQYDGGLLRRELAAE